LGSRKRQRGRRTRRGLARLGRGEDEEEASRGYRPLQKGEFLLAVCSLSLSLSLSLPKLRILLTARVE
jgi:hypothetical protein